MKTATFASLPLESGAVLAPVTLAWSQYGPRPAQARAVILLLHGITSSPQAMAVPESPVFFDRGWFSSWIGPGLVFDTAKDCVLVPNALGSCFGTTGPGSLPSPASFPRITIHDTVELYALWLRSLGIQKLAAVAGYSYGGYQAFQWAMHTPLPTGKAVVLASAPRGNGTAADVAQLRSLARRMASGEQQAAEDWLQMRLDTLMRYGYADKLKDDACPHLPQRLETEARLWTSQFSAWPLACLRAAAVDFDVSRELAAGRNSMPLLWLKCASDPLFPCGFEGLENNTRVQAHCIAGKYGHSSPVLESGLWTGHVGRFLKR